MWAIRYVNLQVYYSFQRENGVIVMGEKEEAKTFYSKTEAQSMFNGLYNEFEREHVKVEFEFIGS